MQLVTSRNEFYAGQAEQSDLSYSLTVPEGSLMVRGHEAQLNIVLDNLVGNAIKFAAPNGTIAITLSAENGAAILTVSDTGIGIEPDELDLIFARFHRGRNAAVYPGSGLGLAIAALIVDHHSGQISAESDESSTRFIVTLPLENQSQF